MRRNDIYQMTPTELAIREAILKVEELPADTCLTEAVMLLMQAKDKVADFIDGLPLSPKHEGSTSGEAG